VQEPDDTLVEGTFTGLDLSEPLRRTVAELGYEAPTPIQQQTIPLLLAGRDVVGQAQTGTGKTAAFALPILQKLDLSHTAVQALVLTPTRELTIQVAEAFHTYSRGLGRVRVLPVYGGQAIQLQLSRLHGGVHIVVGTPGRIMDHLRRGTLSFTSLKMLVLDEADEMLQMGFIEDVEWILSQAPDGLQIALFSATMPPEIRRIAERHLHDPANILIEHRTVTVPNVEQRYVQVTEAQKLDALSRLLETGANAGEATLVFVRTKVRAAEIAERLQARGYAAEEMHGDMSQAQREIVLRRLRSGQVELVVATDVAARGLDVEQIGLVINYDMPYDAEWYVHRIGRTARAGRPGRALLFISPREQRLLRDIERYTRQPIERIKLPTQADVAARRVALFKEQILQGLADEDLEMYLSLVQELAEESGRDMAEIAASAARLARGDKPLMAAAVAAAAPGAEATPPDPLPPPEDGMVRLFIDVGRNQGVRPADIVGAIANEADVPGRAIGAIDIYDRFTFVEVPSEYREAVLVGMSGASIRNREVNVSAAAPPGLTFERGEGADRREERRGYGDRAAERGSRRPGPHRRGPAGPHAPYHPKRGSQRR
jgi:ATP-dependent RNA helicase DeaD